MTSKKLRNHNNMSTKPGEPLAIDALHPIPDTCILQRQCLDPGKLEFDHVDCVVRKSCDDPLDLKYSQDSRDSTTLCHDFPEDENIPSLATNSSPSGSERVQVVPSREMRDAIMRPPTIRAVPSAAPGKDVLPIDVFTSLVTLSMILLLFAVIYAFIVKSPSNSKK